MNVQEYFNKTVPEIVQARQKEVERVGCVYQFNVTGPDGGTWYLDCKVPTCLPGTHSNPGVTVTASAETFKILLGNFSTALALYFKGLVKTQGDTMLLTKLKSIFAA